MFERYRIQETRHETSDIRRRSQVLSLKSDRWSMVYPLRSIPCALIVLLLLLFPLLSQVLADTDQPDLFPQRFGPRLEGTEAEIQTLINQLSKQLTSDPYRTKLYYYLARAYAKQGWQGKAAQYMHQWMKFNKTNVMIKGFHAFVVDEKNDEVLVIDMTTKQVVRKIDVGWFPRRMIPTPDGSRLYVTNALSNSVSAIDTEKMAVTKTIKTGLMPWDGESSSQGDRIYVANLKSNDVSVIDTKGDTVLETVKVGKGPWSVAVSPDGHTLYVSNQGSHNVQVIDTGSYSIVDVINVGTHPRDIVLAPDDEKKLYAVDSDIISDEVEIYVVDLEDAQVVEALRVPATDDPLLSRVGKMSLEDRLESMASSARSDEKARERVAKPGIDEPDRVTLEPRSSSLPARPVTAKDTVSEPAKPVPSAAPVKPEPVKEDHVSVPPASSDESPPPREPVPAPEPVKLPMGDPAALIEPEPAREAYGNVPPALSRKALPEEVPSLSKPRGGEASPPVGVDVPSKTPPAALIEPEPVSEAYAKLPSVSSREVLPEPVPAEESESETTMPQEVPRQEKRVQRIIVVVKHDTLWRLSINNYGMANNSIVKAIQDVNPAIEDVNKIYVGQEIKLPAMDNIGKTVVVKPRDNLFRIALNNYGTVNERIYDAILRVNPHIEDVSMIKVGQSILLPGISERTVVVKPRDNLFRIALSNYGTVNQKIYSMILEANPHIEDITRIEVGQKIILPALPDVIGGG